ncbi:MAG: T9SS type A sorting domain-containing protein [Bacteroidota bacterium]
MKKFHWKNILFLFLFSLFPYFQTISQTVDPYKFIATLQYDGCDFFDSGESNFPLSFRFNTTQDANGDSSIDVEDNLENLVLYSIGDSIYGTGRTGVPDRGPNNQKPALYFHLVSTPDYDVYEYWLYYGDNNWVNDHEHDWEKYFVYVQDTIPYYILLSSHTTYNIYSWADIISDNYHAYAGVDGGSHAMKNSAEDGVRISYYGEITKNNGTLNTADSITIPWTVYSNDTNVANCINYIQSPDTFYYGDPSYLTNSNEWGDPNPAPWIRDEWDNPPAVTISGNSSYYTRQQILCYPNPAYETLYIETENIKADCIRIYSIDGSLVYEKYYSKRNPEIININNLQRGIYFLKVSLKEKVYVNKIIVL